MRKACVLIVEDDPDGRRSVEEAIADMGFETRVAATGLEGVEAFGAGRTDVVLTDLALPDIEGTEVMTRILREDPGTPVMIMTAYGTVSSAVEAMKAGAYDYVTKPLDLDDIQSKVKRAVEVSGLRAQVAHLSASVQGRYGVDRMVVGSASMQDLVRRMHALADTHATVLVQGESGTGKELVARALHADGQRRAGPFVAVNCGAFAETLLESELFGHEKGAFTGATERRKGAFERADGGTLFLDEVGNAPMSVQIKLLRVLEERELLRLGGQQVIAVDVRLVSASNQDLGEMVAAGDFREDLLYRLNVVTLQIPPLRDRRDDIREMVDRFVVAACEAHGRRIERVEEAAYKRLEAFDWPGNVRQLRNVVESSVVMCAAQALREVDLNMPGAKPVAAGGSLVVPDDMTLDDIEREVLTQMLRRHEGNRTLVAEKLGVARRTIQRKIKDFGLPF